MADKIKVTNTTLNIRGVTPKVTLQPGVNYVDAADWEEAKRHEMTQTQLEQGLIVEGDPKPVDAPAAPADAAAPITPAS